MQTLGAVGQILVASLSPLGLQGRTVSNSSEREHEGQQLKALWDPGGESDSGEWAGAAVGQLPGTAQGAGKGGARH